jgi:hypothetical protein
LVSAKNQEEKERIIMAERKRRVAVSESVQAQDTAKDTPQYKPFTEGLWLVKLEEAQWDDSSHCWICRLTMEIGPDKGRSLRCRIFKDTAAYKTFDAFKSSAEKNVAWALIRNRERRDGKGVFAVVEQFAPVEVKTAAESTDSTRAIEPIAKEALENARAAVMDLEEEINTIANHLGGIVEALNDARAFAQAIRSNLNW